MTGINRGRCTDATSCQVISSQAAHISCKKGDLVDLRKAGIIPTECHEHYKTLPSQQNNADRLPLPDVLESDSDSDTDNESNT